MYESKGQPLLPRPRFIRRLLLHVAAALTLTAVSLFIGIAGYIRLEGHDWDQAFLNASMMLGGIGPATRQRLSRAGFSSASIPSTRGSCLSLPLE